MTAALPSTVAEFRRKIGKHHGEVFGPPQFADWVKEERSWKEGAYIGNWSRATPALRYRGPDAIRLFSDCSVNSLANFEIGQSKHIIHTNTDGKVIEEGILTRTGEEELLAYSTFWADHIRRHGDYNVEMDFVEEDEYHVQGPKSLYILEKLTDAPLRSMKYMRTLETTIAGVPVRILRQGMSGEVGFEVQMASDQGQIVWDAILEAGEEFSIQQMGGRVVMLNHLQAGYPTLMLDYLPGIFGEDAAGYLAEMGESAADLNDYYWAIAGSYEAEEISEWLRSPIELGWANRINFDHSFIGDAALKAELEAPKRKLVTLKWNSDDVVGIFAEFFRQGGELPDFMEMPQDPRGYIYSDKVLVNGEVVGATTSRGYSAHFREMISHAVLDIDYTAPGTEVVVIWGNPGSPQREIRAIVAPSPYKPVKSRVDLSTLPATA